jgi:hypothetical protein
MEFGVVANVMLAVEMGTMANARPVTAQESHDAVAVKEQGLTLRKRRLGYMQKQLEAFERGDGAKWGVSDWYEEKREALIEAIKSDEDWTTGWYGSKKEIASARITRIDGKYDIEVSVSDDFDTMGLGRKVINVANFKDVEDVLAVLEANLDEAHQEALDNQKENREYEGFAILNKAGQWVETFIADISEWCMGSPPGDNYHQWGFQGDCELPEDVKEKFAEWVYHPRHIHEKSYTVGDYTIKRWDD